MPVPERDIIEAHRAMVDRVAAIVARDPRDRPPERKPATSIAIPILSNPTGQRGCGRLHQRRRERSNH